MYSYMYLLILLSVSSVALGDSCTSYNHPKYGQSGQCMSKSCCAYSNYISDLCGGENACCFSHNTCGSAKAGCPAIVSRSSWGARSPKSISHLSHQPVKYAFIHHGESGACTTQSSCSAIVRSYQNYHMDSHGWNDIGYSFLIGEDGQAYEGRGWDRVGAHTQGYNSVGLGFCMIGSFGSHVPNSAAISTLKNLLACGVSKGKISSSYVLRGHRDMGSTDCPGQALYNLIRTWPHY